MAFVCTESDRKDLDGFLARVLDAHTDGQITRNRAVIIVAHVMLAAAASDHNEFRSFIRLRLEKYPLDVHKA